MQQVWAELAPADTEFLRAELGYFGAVTGVSGALYPVPKDQRRAAAGELVRKARATRPRRGRSRPGQGVAWAGLPDDEGGALAWCVRVRVRVWMKCQLDHPALHARDPELPGLQGQTALSPMWPWPVSHVLCVSLSHCA